MRAVKTRSSAVLVLVFVIVAAACGGAATPTGTTASFDTATKGPVASGGAATGAPTSSSPSFGQILGSAKVSEYKVTYKMAANGGGEQSWYSKPPKTRYDLSTGVGGQTSTVPDSDFTLPAKPTILGKP